MATIFISYRRGKARDAAARLSDYLANHYGAGEVFLDVRSIKPGAPFDDRIREQIDLAEAIVVVIDEGWLESDGDSSRLDDPQDWVRREIEQALARATYRVLPVLLDKAQMPAPEALPASIQAFAARQAVRVRYESWGQDAAALIGSLEGILKEGGTWKEHARDLSRNLREPSSRRYYAPSTTVAEVANVIVAFFKSSNLESQALDIPEGCLVQARSKKGWHRLVGLQTSLDVLLDREGDFLVARIAPGEWGSRKAAAAASLIYLPLAAMPAYGAWRQAKLPDQIYDLIQSFVDARTTQ